jgi:Zn-dependent M28 family amino/carboxypeptidase
MRAQMEVARKALKFAADEGAAVVIDPSRQGDGGTLFVAQASIPGAPAMGGGGGSGGAPQGKRQTVWDKNAPKIVPQVTVTKEQFNRLVRMLKAGETLKMAVDIAVQYHDDDLMAYNTVAEIPGTDLKDEVVMLGGHIDSWHSGTGATDNGAGVAVAIEAARIIKAAGLKPRRTIRVGLWSGEEQGLLGSRAYVAKHFGKTPPSFGGPPVATNTASNGSTPKDSAASAPTSEFEKFAGYFNLDNGTGKIRGVYLQGNEAVRPIFRKWLQPFKEMGATTLTISNTGGTDHQSFDGIGLPGFQFIQDVVEYNSRTHHSNQDVFDRIQADDMKQAAVIMASFVYNAATADEKLPRKPATSSSR